MGLMFAGCVDEEPTISHVHGAAITESGDILLATHHGMVKGELGKGGAKWSHVGDSRDDFMSLAQDGANPSTLYGSGHPRDRQAFGGSNMGLIRSTDEGATWDIQSHAGIVDFHALAAVPGKAGIIAGPWAEELLVSTDGGLTWKSELHPTAGVISLASDGSRWIAATVEGLQISDALQDITSWTLVEDSSLHDIVSSVAVSDDGTTWLASIANGVRGRNYISTDGGETFIWLQFAPFAEEIRPLQFAFAPATNDTMVVSSSTGRVWHSTDVGGSWTTLRD